MESTFNCASTRRCNMAAWKMAPALWPTRCTRTLSAPCCAMYCLRRVTTSEAPGMSSMAFTCPAAGGHRMASASLSGSEAARAFCFISSHTQRRPLRVTPSTRRSNCSTRSKPRPPKGSRLWTISYRRSMTVEVESVSQAK